MGRFRARPFYAATAVAAAMVIVLRAQSREGSRISIQNVGLTGIDEGVIADESHTPATPETARRAALQASLVRARVGRAASRSVPGRILVRCRDAAAAAERQAALVAVWPGAAMTARLSYADFDIVRI